MSESKVIVSTIEGRAIPFVGNDIDTDRIIPARFLRCVTFEGLGEQVFYDERFDAEGSVKKHPFNDARFAGGVILIVNSNFGCGSSREHAPQAIMRFGIRGIIGESFAEIFAGNCTSLGIPVFTGDESIIKKLQQRTENDPETVFSLDIAAKTISFDGDTISLQMNDSARTALLGGTWDTLDVLLQNKDAIEKVHRGLPYTTDFC